VAAPAAAIEVVGPDDLADLLPLVRGYCDFYGVACADADLLALSRALIADPESQGLQLIARAAADGGQTAAIGFATIFWSWSTLSAARIGVMNDLFVAPQARGTGVAGALIAACADRCRVRGVRRLSWITAPDNHRAQRVYERVGGRRSEWVHYDLEVPSQRP
jgi:GNAT superfamily N-acetyltransferase